MDKRSSVSFFNIEKPKTAVSRWARTGTRAAKIDQRFPFHISTISIFNRERGVHVGLVSFFDPNSERYRNSQSLSSSSLDGMEKIHCPDVEYGRYLITSFVGCCNGLLCIHIDDMGIDFSLWNPSTGDCKRIPSPPDQFDFDFSLHSYLPVIGYGFGYDSNSDD
ncbi:hypothetical protein MKW98_016053 [Papaver atlanticum]|uniref:F-box protein n=1 Tax=Papaver atlanticum TaxID=357466 RepID=A0AAD4T3C6_9MAGN|nr:hypothetical protein MKW98_016053 [Papaver atlanticum]